MLTLDELQKQFSRALNNIDQHIIQHIHPSVKMDAKTHFSIYKNSVTGTLQKALKEIFPVVLKLVGEEFFLEMAYQYIQITPSRSVDLGDFGDEFANFIDSFLPAKSLPYLADVACLEWAWHQTLSAPDSETLDFEKLAACYQTQGEKIIFTLQKNSFLLESRYPIHQIFEMNQAESTIQEIILTDHQPFYFLIWRHQHEMRIECITNTEWHILCWIREEYTLEQISALVATHFPHIHMSEIFPHFVSQHWIGGFKF